MNGIYLLLGTNLGDRLSNLRKASELIQEKHIRILNESSIYETEPWGTSDQPWFLNVVLQIETQLKPQELLEACLYVEKDMGRIRKEKWGSRLIDIDILYFNEIVIKSDNLEVPHPAIEDRLFTLIPMTEIASDELHPVSKETQASLLGKCQDKLLCKLTEFRL